MTFKTGTSGNPSGRPRGAKNKWSKIREDLAADIPEILDALIAQAKGGDTQAAKLLIDRTLPPLKSVDTPITVPLGDSDSLAAQGNAVVAQMLTGKLTPSEASTMLSALSAQVRITEADEMAKRLDVIEERLKVSS